ncbi:NAD(P)-binding protein [Gymnopus androsaceus JB14]|uniref:NAD(P)-binding protein n=1 Tax=Gymnopus androsaceus JB14 TaxID=1447944 RepID=A0A6A4H8U0_9AGAR|nr:NAD(P)-binding protein [Gymnopus androsaceus JB14]
MSTQSLSIFLLGATGYVGGQVLVSLSTDFPTFPIRTLARNLSPGKTDQLKSLHPKVETVEGSLTDVSLIEEEAAKADIVINVAVAGDIDSVTGEDLRTTLTKSYEQNTYTAILRGLKQRSNSSQSSQTPIYIHMSGTAITGDNARGELITPERLWIDTEFNLNNIKDSHKLLPGACEAVVEASKTGEIRTMIVLPGVIYGIGPGVQKISLPHRFILNMAAQAGHSGTFGPGRNILGIIHLKDVANAVSAVLKGALSGSTIGEGEKGFYFVLSKYMVSISEFSGIIGDTLFRNGLISRPGSSPFSASVADSTGPVGYTVFGSSQFCRAERLSSEFGWTAEHTERSPLQESLPEEIEFAVKEMGLVFKGEGSKE